LAANLAKTFKQKVFIACIKKQLQAACISMFSIIPNDERIATQQVVP